LPYYLMDLASILAALALDVREGQAVADFCAAPGKRSRNGDFCMYDSLALTHTNHTTHTTQGGKSLVLAELLAGSTGTLVTNDRSKARSARLARTLRDYIPPASFGGVRVVCQDASKWFGHARHWEVRRSWLML
jgi:16S rRNA C967 or C1407 C5-methylase (RsmB/RsmF family)